VPGRGIGYTIHHNQLSLMVHFISNIKMREGKKLKRGEYKNDGRAGTVG